MTAQLDTLLDAGRRSQIAANEAAMGIHPVFSAALAAFRAPLQIQQIQRDAYVKALQVHDWAFEFSDDADTYRAGRESLAQLRLARRELDPDFSIWNKHAPAQCRNGAAYA